MTERRSQKRVLVTGGAGFIGSAFVRAAVEAHHEVVVLDNLQTGSPESLDGLDVEIVEGDVTDVRLLGEVVPRATHVVHLAAQTGVQTSLQDPEGDCVTNVLGTLRLLEACRTADIQRFVLASSNAVLGNQDTAFDERKTPLPLSPYGASKLAAEAYCQAYHRSFGLSTVVLRFSNVYGPYATHKSSVVQEFIRRIISGDHLAIHGDGRQVRDFLFVTDLADAVLRALEAPIEGEVLQIASGISTSVLELTEMLGNITGSTSSIMHEDPRPGDIRRSSVDISQARELLRWEPQVTLEDGLRQTYQWCLANLPPQSQDIRLDGSTSDTISTA